jgi:hypothetical protein
MACLPITLQYAVFALESAACRLSFHAQQHELRASYTAAIVDIRCTASMCSTLLIWQLLLYYYTVCTVKECNTTNTM